MLSLPQSHTLVRQKQWIWPFRHFVTKNKYRASDEPFSHFCYCSLDPFMSPSEKTARDGPQGKIILFVFLQINV